MNTYTAEEYFDKECAWCNENQGTTNDEVEEYEGTTHGICEDCADEVMEDLDSDSD